jgi:hypothetical protein
MKFFALLLTSGLFFCAALPAADLTGIWTGQLVGRNDEKQDVAFQFKPGKGSYTGVMFGDEFDLPVQELTVASDRITFSITNINYYDGRRIKFVFSGTIGDKEMQLTRERVGAPSAAEAKKPQNAKQTFILKKVD